MWTSPGLFGAVAVLLVACSSSPPPAVPSEPEAEPERPTAPVASEPETDGAAGETEPETKPETKPEAPADAAPRRAEPRETTPRDCDGLGDQLARVTLNDALAELSPKLSSDKRRQAEEGFSEVAQKVGERWAASCRGSLVGGFTDDASIKCAMRSKTVAEFDGCINGPAPAK